MADTTQVLRVNRLFDMSDLAARLLVVALRVLEGFVLSDRALEIGVNLFSADAQSTIVHDETDLFDREFLSLGEVKVDQGEPEAIEGNINSIAEMSDRWVSDTCTLDSLFPSQFGQSDRIDELVEGVGRVLRDRVDGQTFGSHVIRGDLAGVGVPEGRPSNIVETIEKEEERDRRCTGMYILGYRLGVGCRARHDDCIGRNHTSRRDEEHGTASDPLHVQSGSLGQDEVPHGETGIDGREVGRVSDTELLQDRSQVASSQPVATTFWKRDHALGDNSVAHPVSSKRGGDNDEQAPSVAWGFDKVDLR